MNRGAIHNKEFFIHEAMAQRPVASITARLPGNHKLRRRWKNIGKYPIIL
jgi:hypothetical protein